MFRLLGTGEHSLWLYDQVAPLHFAVTARIVGEFSTDQLQQALAWVQQRHPLLRVSIIPDASEKPWFVEHSTSIPMRVVQRQGEQHWHNEVEKELSEPFDSTQAPLVRVTLVYSTTVSELILTCYHSIGDGLSVVYLLRDILQAVGIPDGEQQILPKRPCFEDLISDMAVTSQDLSSQQENTSEPQAINQEVDNEDELSSEISAQSNISPNRRPRILSSSLSSAETTSLIECCKQEQTTVHAAICAAFLLAIYDDSEQQSDFKCYSPVNIRRYLSPPIAEDFGYYFSFGLTSHTLTPDLTLWDLARTLKSQLDQQIAPDKIFERIPQMQALLSTNPSPSLMNQVLVEACSYDILVSNLGRLDIPQQFGDIQLQAVYGPTVTTYINSDRLVGVATLGDRMFFTFTYLEPDILPAEAVRILQAAMQQLTQKPQSNIARFDLLTTTKGN